MHRAPALILSLGLTLAVTACGGDEATERGEAAPTTATGAAPAADDANVTEDVRASASGASWIEQMTAATLTEPGRITVETTIVDPRGDAGSPAAQQAIQLCEGVVAYLKGTGEAQPYVSVMENDGSTFVLYGHPSYPGGCTEV
jgi:hypothetical protein